MPLFDPDRPELALLTLQRHARGAARNAKAVRAALEAGDHTCRGCAMHMPGWMEIHHADGDHDNWDASNLQPICHFCHLLEHPVQPGSEADAPMRPLWWPDIAPPELMALAWAALWLADVCDDANRTETTADDGARLQLGLHARPLRSLLDLLETEISRRAELAVSVAGTASVGALLEAADQRARAGEPEPDEWDGLRLWPAAVCAGKRRSLLGAVRVAAPWPATVPLHFLLPAIQPQPHAVAATGAARLALVDP